MAFDFGTIGPRLDALDDYPAGTPRGRALEDLVVEIFESLPGVRVAERNLLSGFGEAEIDSTWVNESLEHGLIGFPRDVLMECKSSQDPLNAAGVEYFASQASRRGVKWSLIVSLNGITGTPERSNAAQLEVRRAAEQDTWVMVLVAEELRALRSAEHLEAVIGAKHRRQFGTMTAVTLTAAEIANLDPNRGKFTFSRGWEAIERATRKEEDRVINEVLDAAVGLADLQDDEAAVERAAESLRALAAQYAEWQENQADDPLMRTIRSAVLVVGSVFAVLLPENVSDNEMRRIVGSEVRTGAPRRLAAHVGDELWDLLSSYYTRRIKAFTDHARRTAVIAILALVLEEIVAIDNIDPADVFDDYDHYCDYEEQ